MQNEHSIFSSDVAQLRKMLTDTINLHGDVTTVSADTAREISSRYNCFFDALYQKFEDNGCGFRAGVNQLSSEDKRVYVPALRKAYQEYVKGWIPRLNAYVTA